MKNRLEETFSKYLNWDQSSKKPHFGKPKTENIPALGTYQEKHIWTFCCLGFGHRNIGEMKGEELGRILIRIFILNCLRLAFCH